VVTQFAKVYSSYFSLGHKTHFAKRLLSETPSTVKEKSQTWNRVRIVGLVIWTWFIDGRNLTKICRPSADILCSRPPVRLESCTTLTVSNPNPVHLKFRAPIRLQLPWGTSTPILRFLQSFCASLAARMGQTDRHTDERTDGWTGKTRNAVY